MNRPALYFWFNSPPKVERGAYNYVSQEWGAPVVYVTAGNLRAERISAGWDDGNFGAAKVVRYEDEAQGSELVRSIAESSKESIHVVAGFSGSVGRRLGELCRVCESKQLVVVSERPGVYGSRFKQLERRIGSPFKQRWLRRRFRSHIGGLLPLGERGVDYFASIGWPREVMQEFMYCPDCDERCSSAQSSGGVSGVVRFLYVGRLSASTKGVDTLLKAFSCMPSEGWTLSIAGGYGEMTNDVAAWAKNRANVALLGTVRASDVAELMRRHDVCVVPSRFDGWNVVINEAICAGIGVLASDETVSDELVRESEAGLVVRAGDAVALRDALLRCVESTEMVSRWRESAVRYSERVMPETVGTYLMTILDRQWHEEPGSVRAPWR